MSASFYSFVGFGLATTGTLYPGDWAGFRENLPERLDRLIGEERMPPVVVAFPDCFTRLGGNQYINSAVRWLPTKKFRS